MRLPIAESLRSPLALIAEMKLNIGWKRPAKRPDPKTKPVLGFFILERKLQ